MAHRSSGIWLVALRRTERSASAVLDVEVRQVEPAELRSLLRELAHRFLAVTNPIDQSD